VIPLFSRIVAWIMNVIWVRIGGEQIDAMVAEADYNAR